ncbi:NRDE family protein [Lysinibacillus sp. LZ02]|uniref:NRDE family protein n=1 Tax=Lysinibacillus sp. LZ02 TaxID=3420668 RepID=UPI003D366F9E
MCIIAFSYKTHPDFPIIITANRDEFYIRETKTAHIWENAPHILAGRDGEKGGTWLGVSKSGRFVAITNYRNPLLADKGTYSRGQIATDFLNSNERAEQFALNLQVKRDLYGPFNVLLYDGDKLFHYNNMMDEVTEVQPGIHCVSNATLNTPWPKVELLKDHFTKVLMNDACSDDDLFHILTNKQQASDEALPSTGVPLELERKLSPIFIQFEGYGTRCSTVVRLDKTAWHFTERTFEQGEYHASKQFQFPIEKEL